MRLLLVGQVEALPIYACKGKLQRQQKAFHKKNNYLDASTSSPVKENNSW